MSKDVKKTDVALALYSPHRHSLSRMDCNMSLKIDIIIAVLIGIWALRAIYSDWSKMKRQIDAQDERIRLQSERIEKLESANRTRMPYKAVEEILDARAALGRLKEEYRLYTDFIENAEGHLDNAVTTGTKREEK